MFVIGPTVAGISGTETGGAYSIVASQCGMDKDRGEPLIYSEANAETATTKTPEKEQKAGTKILLRSIENRKPIRVIRGSTRWDGAPACGFRYDGIYSATESFIRENKLGGKYYEFKLVRLPKQDPINKTIPTPQQKKQCEKSKLGY
jgi:hypothetical protein